MAYLGSIPEIEWGSLMWFKAFMYMYIYMCALIESYSALRRFASASLEAGRM